MVFRAGLARLAPLDPPLRTAGRVVLDDPLLLAAGLGVLLELPLLAEALEPELPAELRTVGLEAVPPLLRTVGRAVVAPPLRTVDRVLLLPPLLTVGRGVPDPEVRTVGREVDTLPPDRAEGLVVRAPEDVTPDRVVGLAAPDVRPEVDGCARAPPEGGVTMGLPGDRGLVTPVLLVVPGGVVGLVAVPLTAPPELVPGRVEPRVAAPASVPEGRLAALPETPGAVDRAALPPDRFGARTLAPPVDPDSFAWLLLLAVPETPGRVAGGVSRTTTWGVEGSPAALSLKPKWAMPLRGCT